MVYTGRYQNGSASAGHVLDVALAAMGLAATATTIGPADFRAIGAAAIGSLIGGLIAAVMFRDERVKLEAMWGVSFAVGVLFAPALFDWMSLPVYADAAELEIERAPLIRRDVNMLVATAGLLSIAGWGTLRALYVGWLEILERWFKRRAGDE